MNHSNDLDLSIKLITMNINLFQIGRIHFSLLNDFNKSKKIKFGFKLLKWFNYTYCDFYFEVSDENPVKLFYECITHRYYR